MVPNLWRNIVFGAASVICDRALLFHIVIFFNIGLFWYYTRYAKVCDFENRFVAFRDEQYYMKLDSKFSTEGIKYHSEVSSPYDIREACANTAGPWQSAKLSRTTDVG